MRRIYFLLFLLFLFYIPSSFGQGGTWTWISGDSATNSLGVYGTQGIPSVFNHPPCLYEACQWKDKQGNFWIFSGGAGDLYSDLWKYNPLTNEWTWVNGNGQINDQAVYGIKGVPNASNTPGGRSWNCASWVDTSGNLWLFGGSPDGENILNDLWIFSIYSNNWTWVSGDTLPNSLGIYGVQGVPSIFNVPYGRSETSSAWTDSMNNLWLFGGLGSINYAHVKLNDLCKYDIAANEWTWMKGSTLPDAPSIYGIKGIADTANDPGARITYTNWKDLKDNFWLMGGQTDNILCANDVWKYDRSVNAWTWMAGTNIPGDTGSYHNKCIFDTLNNPCVRFLHRSAATDNCGKFWLFGGGNINGADLNDFWVFDPEQLKWDWLSGTNIPYQEGNYGTLGLPSPSNMSPSRQGALAWWGNNNKFYVFGGFHMFVTLCDLWLFNPDTNCVSSSCGTVAVVPPVADFQVSQASICANDCINFTDHSTNAASWQWLFAGAIDSTTTSQNPQNICYSKAGIYNVTLIASNGAGSDTVTYSNYITVNAAPPTPVITQVNDTLFCSTNPSYSTYQWYVDSNIITSATDSFLVISKSGNYNVEVANANHCSAAVGINIVYGIQNYSSDNVISIYPNPATDELLIDGSWKMGDGSLKLAIINVLGQTIYTEELNSKPSTVNCKPFPSGIYFVQVSNESGMRVGKFVKE